MRQLPRFVLDASVAAGWVVPKQNTDYKKSVLDSLASDSALVPALWHLEMANLLARRLQSKHLQEFEILELAQFLSNLPIQTDDFDNTRQERTRNFQIGPIAINASAWGLTSYDAHYLQLAIRSGLPLATTDDALMQAAKRCGIQIFQP